MVITELQARRRFFKVQVCNLRVFSSKHPQEIFIEKSRLTCSQDNSVKLKKLNFKLTASSTMFLTITKDQ